MRGRDGDFLDRPVEPLDTPGVLLLDRAEVLRACGELLHTPATRDREIQIDARGHVLEPVPEIELCSVAEQVPMLGLAAAASDRPRVLIDRRRVGGRGIRLSGGDHFGVRHIENGLALSENLEVVGVLVLVPGTEVRRKRG
jgi:hypothetical protein